MGGDFSRLSFDPAKHYTSVLLQQGRVALDSDANEQASIDAHRHRRATADIVGPAGAPESDPGFAITVEPGNKLGIGKGIFYVDGLRCENAAKTTADKQPHLPGKAPVFLGATGTPATTAQTGSRYLAFLDVWTELVTPIDDPSLREEALGVDTALRAQTVWQVKLLRVGTAGDATLTCDAAIPTYASYIKPPSGTLAARARAAAPADNPCMLPETAGYQRLENHLYRVEIHRGGTQGSATPPSWKWSRDNAQLAVRWLSSDGDVLTVADIGRDQASGFANGQWVELTDLDRELQGLPGVLVRLLSVSGNRLRIDPATADGATAFAGFGRNPRVRAWDSAGAVPIAIPATNDGFVAVESGVEVKFASAARYRSGDFWTMPARSGSGIQWPLNGAVPAAKAPDAITHAYARLAILDFTAGVWTLVGDCRALFPPLTGLTALSYLGGDGQEAMPDPLVPANRITLAAPLRVGVSRGGTPVAGARVRFTIEAGDGRLDPAVAGGKTSVDRLTSANGEASVPWAVDAATASQRVRAQLLDTTGLAKHLAVLFTANLSTAAEVSFDPAATPELSGANTVQKAIEALYKRDSGGGCVKLSLSPDSDWVKALAALPAGQDATICFRQGDFAAKGTVTLTGLGAVVVHGSGAASRISVTGSETALEFVGCASVVVRDLSIAAPDGGDAFGPIEHLNGALSITACPEVEVRGTTLRCGANVRADRTCLTVRAAPPNSDHVTQPLSRVVIAGNDLTAGFGQAGILVTDALDAEICDNRLWVAPRPGNLSFEKLVAEPRRRARLARILADGFAETQAQAAGQGGFRVGDFVVTMPTNVDRAEWVKAIGATPAKPEQLASADTVKAYIDQVADTLVKTAPEQSSAGMQLKRMRVLFGQQSFQQLTDEVKRGLVTGGEVTVKPVVAAPSGQHNIIVTAGNFRIAFRSILQQRDWDQIMPAVGAVQAESAALAIRTLKLIAKRLVTDAKVQAKVGALGAWITALKANNPTVGDRAITVAGAAARDALVQGNAVDGYVEGVRLAVSRTGEQISGYARFASVVVADNRLRLRLPIEFTRGTSALTIGNADRVRVTGNDIEWAQPRTATNEFAQAIRVWGHLGAMVQVAGNYAAAVAPTGLLVVQEGTAVEQNQVQWLAADNYFEGVAPANTVHAPAAMLKRNNRPG